MFSQIITDLVKLFANASQLPDPKDRAAVKAYALRVVPDVIDLVYDAGGIDNVEAALLELKATSLRGENVGAFGDGAIIQYLIAHGAEILALIKMIMAMFASVKPAPVVVPDGPTV